MNNQIYYLDDAKVIRHEYVYPNATRIIILHEFATLLEISRTNNHCGPYYLDLRASQLKRRIISIRIFPK